MKKSLTLAILIAVTLTFSPSFVAARIRVTKPESLTLSTAQGLMLELTNQIEGLPNNDSVAYLVLNGKNKSGQIIKLRPAQFELKDSTGKVIEHVEGKEALKLIVNGTYLRSKDYIRIAGMDLRDVLRNENRRYTDKELTEISLNPQEEIKEKILFFPKLEKGKYTLALGKDVLQLKIADAVYFMRADEQSQSGKSSK
ncbi:MAG TPA: hypothetical protein VGK99_21075 [Acidobacteriota bacterium]|jgi:hypothetical protein